MWCLYCFVYCFLCRCREKAKKRKGKDKDTPSSPTEEAESNQFDDFKDLPPVRAGGSWDTHAHSFV